MRFLRPEIAWWLAGALVALGFVRWRVRRGFVASTTVSRLGAAIYRAPIVRRLPLCILAIALALIALALMDPVLPSADTEVQSRGLDIVMLLDLSSSMQEQMERVRPSRDMARLTFTSTDSMTTRVQGKTRLEATKEALKA